MALPRRCIDCGTITRHGTRCGPCDTRNHQAAYGGTWAAVSRKQRAAVPFCECLGGFCSFHAGPCRSTTDLTVDHVIPHAHGGTVLDGVRTLCRRCNAAKRDRMTSPALSEAPRGARKVGTGAPPLPSDLRHPPAPLPSALP